MKVMLLGAGSVIHTQRWANGLAGAGVDVLCASQHDFLPDGWDSRVRRERLPRSGLTGYLLNAAAVAQWFESSGCDLINAHYATGYGMLATRSKVRPRIVSVWGSDVYDFPKASPVHKALVRRVLGSAERVASTSEAMARQVEQLMGGDALKHAIAVTPFGVDIERFVPRVERAAGPLVIGTVKTLAPKYGIDTLIRAFAMLTGPQGGEKGGGETGRGEKYGGERELRVRIVGDGPQRAELEALSRSLGIGALVEFVGPVAHAEVPAQLQGFDIFVAASRLDSESFGVAVIEASACGLPVVVTRVGGLPEVVRDNETGLIVERDDPAALASAIERLVDDPALRADLGRRGRELVCREYEWSACVRKMVGVFESVVSTAAAQAVGAR